MERINEVDRLKKKAEEIRYDIVSMIAEAGSGHPGGSLSGADLGSVLFFNEMKYDPKIQNWEIGTDSFFQKDMLRHFSMLCLRMQVILREVN